MKITRRQLRNLILENLTNAQFFTGADLKGERLLTKNVKFSWGNYKGADSNEFYVIEPGRKELGSIQNTGDPFTYEKASGGRVKVISAPEKYVKSIGKLISLKSQAGKGSTSPGSTAKGQCPIKSSASIYNKALRNLKSLQHAFEAKRSNFPGSESRYLQTSLSKHASEEEVLWPEYEYSIKFEESLSKLLKLLDENYLKVKTVSVGGDSDFTIKGGENNYCKFLLIQNVYHVGTLIYGHPAVQNEKIDNPMVYIQTLFNLGSGKNSRATTHLQGFTNVGSNIKDFTAVVKLIHKRIKIKNTADKFFAISSEAEAKDLSNISMHIDSLKG
jgi:hypothetical protein